MSGPALELADIFRRHGPSYRRDHPMPVEHLRIMRAIEICRTPALGGHVEQCGQCAHRRVLYNSCRNRHCPKCQSLARAQWLEARKAELLPVEYFHVVFTIPESIARIAFHNKAVVYNILFRATAETLLTIGRDPKHLGAGIGFFAILHTWGQNLQHHPHLHCVVPGGGLAEDPDHWVGCRPGFFLPVRVLSRLFRRLFLKMLEKAYQQGELRFFAELEGLRNNSQLFHKYLEPARENEWVVYAKPPFGGPVQVLEYLGRYTHRVAISNQRLVGMRDQEVSFQWKDYRDRDQNRYRTMTVTAQEFIRRFMQHALPPGFQRIRHYGLMSNCHRTGKLALCRKLLAAPMADLLPDVRQDHRELYEALTGRSLRLCPECKTGMMAIVEILPAYRYPAIVKQDSS
jgi:Putative transposase/Transposase zinc-binding domain